MKAYVVVDRKGKIIKEAGIEFSKDAVDLEEFDVDGEPTGEKIKSFTIPELK